MQVIWLRSLTLAALLGQALAPGATAGEAPATFHINPDRSVVRFTVTKLGFAEVTGVFRESAGEIRWNPSEPGASSIRWRVTVASVLTDEPNRDRTLQNPEYFDAARHPELIFESTRVRATGPGLLEVQGRLTMRGQTRPITVPVRYGGSDTAPVFETEFEVDRFDFGIVGGRMMSRLIGRLARIHLQAVAVAPAAAFTEEAG
jgi:polyisoprenoid-binding protein YceI